MDISDTARRFEGDDLVIASHNTGKVREIADLLRGKVARVTSAADHGLDDPEETETTFIGNAALKARYVMARTRLPSLADDSGLAVTALGGEPGIYSARWAERPDGTRDFAWAMERLEKALDGHGDRSARFVCALALIWPDGHEEVVEGHVDGTLTWPPRGDRGFGYDPMFVPNGHSMTFGEMDPDEKHRISHRADAFFKLTDRCFASG